MSSLKEEKVGTLPGGRGDVGRVLAATGAAGVAGLRGAWAHPFPQAMFLLQEGERKLACVHSVSFKTCGRLLGFLVLFCLLCFVSHFDLKKKKPNANACFQREFLAQSCLNQFPGMKGVAL